AEAESWVKEARARLASADPSHMVAAGFYENAIQVYRTVPQAQRAAHRVNERVSELRRELTDAGGKGTAEIGPVSRYEVNTIKMAESSRDAVSGQSAIDALKSLCNLSQGFNAEEAREGARKRLQ